MLGRFNSIFLLFIVVVAINAQQLELDYLFAAMKYERPFELTPPYQKGVYDYSFFIPRPRKPDGPNGSFYLIAGRPINETAEIIINQDGNFFQSLTEKEYWQSNKIPIPLSINGTTFDLHIRDGDSVGPTYTIHAIRAYT